MLPKCVARIITIQTEDRIRCNKEYREEKIVCPRTDHEWVYGNFLQRTQ